MAINRLSGLDVAVFTVGGTSYINDLENATLSVEVQEEDARAIKDQFSYPWATGRSWTLEADVFVGAAATLLSIAGAGSAQVAVAFDSGGNAYSGTGLVTSASHQVNRGGLQMQKITIKGQGPLTIA